jgi:hypothetical protein
MTFREDQSAPPDPVALRELVKSLDARERKVALERTKRLGEYAKALEKALGGPDT